MILALPLVVSTASWTVMNFVDRMFLMWYGTASMAAVLPAGMLHFTAVSLPLGIASYVTTFVAQYHGAGRPERIGLILGQGVRIGLVTVPLFLATIPLAPLVFRAAGHNEEQVGLESTYYECVALGGGANVLAAALSAFFTGRSKTRVVMIVDTLSSLLNIVLDYAWIFGHWGFPEGGIAGAAWATAAAQWSRVLMYGGLMAMSRERATHRLADVFRYDGPLLARLLRFGGPNGLQMLVEVAAFTLFLLLIGRLGTIDVAATTLAFNVNSIAWVPMFGLSVALSTMVGQQLGGRRDDLAARATGTAIIAATLYTAVWAVLYVAVPEVFLIPYRFGADPVEFGQLHGLTIVLLRFVAAYALFDALNLMLSATLKGAGDTAFVLWTNTILCPLPVAAGWIGMQWFGLGLRWCWVMLTLWILALSVIFLLRYRQGRWRQMSVIEPAVDDEPCDSGAAIRPAEDAY